MKGAKELYDNIADTYDFRHSNPSTSVLRKHEAGILKKFVSGRTLDAGCGTGQYFHIADNIIGIDISREMLKHAKPPWRPVIQGDLANLPFSDNTFDTVMCMFSVLNMCDYKKAIKEMSRVTKDGGRIIVSVASVYDNGLSLKEKKGLEITPPAKRKKFRIHKHTISIHLFTKEEIISLFSKGGLVLEYFDSLFSLVNPKWGNFKGFSFIEKIKLRLERILPYKDYGCMYIMVFRKDDQIPKKDSRTKTVPSVQQ